MNGLTRFHCPYLLTSVTCDHLLVGGFSFSTTNYTQPTKHNAASGGSFARIINP